MQLLLLAVAVLSGVFGELRDALAIFAVIIAVALSETLTERRAHRAIAALHELARPVARVRRDGKLVELPAAEVVPGDVLSCAAGDRIPADARVLTAAGLRVDESTLTGEAEPVGKGPVPVAESAELAERTSMLYAGTAAVAGEGSAVVVAGGPDTELGRLGRLALTTREPPTPLQRALGRLARVVLVFALLASVGVPLAGWLAGRPLPEMVLAGLTLAFATVPEELPILVTVLLAVGGRQLAARGALLRRLRAGEALGAVTVVVTDKTGTLTENELHLVELAGDREALLRVALAGQPGQAGWRREPLERELARAAAEAGVQWRGTELAAYPFDPQRKLASRVWAVDGGVLVAVSGAPESVLARCGLCAVDRAAEQARLELLSARGWRVVGFGCRRAAEVPPDAGAAERDLEFVGFAAFADPLRSGVPAAVATLRRAGVDTFLVTGDHPSTAAAVARTAGIPADRVLARATPAGKLDLVRSLQRAGQVVAATGDGVNDAPALAAADVGIAMGRRGSDLAREAADVVLTDDAYPTVAVAVARGRNIGSQLRRAVAFYLGAKAGLVTVMLVPLLLGRDTPFTPAAIVLLELFLDLGASVAFVAEPAAPGAMREPPRRPAAGFFDRTAVAATGLVAVALVVAVLPAYLLVDATGPARVVALAGWLAGHALIAWSVRAQPALPLRANPAFPAWAAAALGTGLAVGLAGGASGGQLGLAAGGVAAALLGATFGRSVLRLGQRL